MDPVDERIGKPYITIEQYLGDNVGKFICEVTPNSYALLFRVNSLLHEINWPHPVIVNSGYRTPEHNKQIGGAKNSLHMCGKAVDISDPNKELYSAILERVELLKKIELWMEDGMNTKDWVHLDIGNRAQRDARIFKP